jgi:hypothetical protein
VKCVDLGVKNFVEVQIVAALSICFAGNRFKNAYILGEDGRGGITRRFC